jgi:hypothetical protein
MRSERSARSCNPGPESALELLPSSALSSAQVSEGYPIPATYGKTGHFAC